MHRSKGALSENYGTFWSQIRVFDYNSNNTRDVKRKKGYWR